MPLNIPSRQDLQTQILADINARVPGADTSLRRSVLRIMAYVWAGSLWLVYRFIAWLAKQLFVDSAEGAYLYRRLAPYGITPEGATYAAGNVILTGTVDFDIPPGTQLQNSDNSIQYATQADATVGDDGTVTVAIVALVAGSAGNAVAGAPLTLSTAIAGIQPTGNVDGNGLTGGTDVETDADLRIRGAQRIQQPPQGGAPTDYVAWAKQVPGVTRVWVYPRNRGLGTVDVLFVMDGRTNNIPLTADIDAVQAVFDVKAPVTADAEAFAPTPDTLTIAIANLNPNNSAMQAAITAQLDALALTVAAGGATVGDGVSASNPGGTLELQQIIGAIRNAAPTGFDLTTPSADVTYATGHIPGAWTVTF